MTVGSLLVGPDASAPRRNGGKTLAAIIESADNGNLDLLTGMSDLTRDMAAQQGNDVTDWPTDMYALFNGPLGRGHRRWSEVDDRGEPHTFVFVPLPSLDALFGVSSRVETNKLGVRTGNLAVNTILRILETVDANGTGKTPLYGTAVVAMISRLLRTHIGVAHIRTHCFDWDVIIRASEMTFDPREPMTHDAFEYHAKAAVDAAAKFKLMSSAHQAAAQHRGVNKYARSVTTPFIRVHGETGQMSYDPAVCAAARDVLTELRQGRSFDDIAGTHGHHFPSWRYRQLPDRDTTGGLLAPAQDVADDTEDSGDSAETESDGVEIVFAEDEFAFTGGRNSGPRSRESLNRRRKVAGLAPLPYRLTEQGEPNPDYRPETYADLPDPGGALRNLFTGGLGLNAKYRTDVMAHVHDDLGGLHPRDATLEFLATGVHRRLQVDQLRSNQRERRFRYSPFDFGTFDKDEDADADDDGRYVFSRDDVDFIKGLRVDGGNESGPPGRLMLLKLFNVDQHDRLWTTRGEVEPRGDFRAVMYPASGTPEPGRLVLTGGRLNDTPCYRLWFEKAASRRTRAVALNSAASLEHALADAMEQALTEAGVEASFKPPSYGTSPFVVDPRQRAQARFDDAQEAVAGAAEALASTRLSPGVRAHLEKMAIAAEVELDAATTDLASIGSTEEPAALHSDTISIGHVADLIALLRSGRRLEIQEASHAQRLLRSILKARYVRVLAREQLVEYEATLELVTSAGVTFSSPLCIRLPNEAKDPWLGGAAGRCWGGRVVFADAFSVRASKTDPVKATTARRRMEARLIETAKRNGLTFRGPRVAMLLVRCPYHVVVETALALVEGEVPDAHPDLVAAVRRLLFELPEDIPPRCQWNPNSTEPGIAEVIRIAAPTQTSIRAKSQPRAAKASRKAA